MTHWSGLVLTESINSVIPAQQRDALREPGPTEPLSRWVPGLALSRSPGMTTYS